MEELEGHLLVGFAKALGVPSDETLRRYVVEGRGRLPAAAKLLAWDANSIHAFVFDTTNATGIRGASDVLRAIDADLGQGASLGLHPGQILFAGGGSGLAVVAAVDVERVVDTLHRLFAERTLVATCTAAAIDLGMADGEFAKRVEAAGRELARERVLAGPDAEPAVPFFVQRCRVCGRRAAAREVPRLAAGRGTRPECEPCFRRLERGKQNLRFQGEPSDFAAIEDRGGFYAVLYLDGNGIGRTLARLPSALRYTRFSRAISTVIEGSFRGVAARHELGEDGGGEAGGGYQLPICGGDDLVAFLPGDAAVPFAADLLASLQQTADVHPDLAGEEIGASAGVAIARSSFPVRHLLAEALDLLADAKRRTYQDGGRGSLSFGVVTDGSPRSEARVPERWGRPGAGLLLSGRPYRLDELAVFRGRLRAVRRSVRTADVGRTQLHTLNEHAARGPAQLRNHVLYQLARRDGWRTLARELGGDAALHSPAESVSQFAPTYGGRRVFDVGDMLELLDHWREAPADRTP